LAVVAKPSVATKKDAAVDDDASAFESETQSLTSNSLIMSDKSKDQSDANEFASKTQSLIEDPPAIPKLAKVIKVEKNATKAISSKMVSPKKPSSKTNVDLKSVKIQSVALKKISPKPLNAIKPKSAVKKPLAANGQKSVTDLVAKTIALAKNKKSNVFTEVMDLAIHEDMNQIVKDDKPKAKKVGKLALINKAFDEEHIYSQVNATHPQTLSVQKKNATKGRPANSKLIQLNDKQVLGQKVLGKQTFTD